MNKKDKKNTIIEEEAQPYFSGEKSVDDVCAIIQDRVNTYISESK